ncbi:hypothetical protein LCGC14_2373790, partial [marine sediment metagenome]
QQRQDIRDSLDGYVNPDLSGYAILATENQRWEDSSLQRQDIRDSLDGYVNPDLSDYAILSTENQRWTDSSQQRQDIRDSLDGYSSPDMSNYALLATENQRWTDSSQQRQDLRNAADGYALVATENQRWEDSSEQRQDIRDSLDGYVNPDLSGYAILSTENQKWTDSSQQRQDLRNAADGYQTQIDSLESTENQRWTDSSQQRQDLRDAADGYYTEDEFLNSSAGAGDAGKPIKLDADGHVDSSMINSADIDHNISDHDTTATGAELETLTSSGLADTLHRHASETTGNQRWTDSSQQRQDIRDACDGYGAVGAHNIASHSDTTATGTELNTLTDNSIANALHRQSELVASDGTPDPAVSIDGTGNLTLVGSADFESYMAIGNGSAPSVHYTLTIDRGFFSSWGRQLWVKGTTTINSGVNNIYEAYIAPTSIKITSGAHPIVSTLTVEEPKITEDGGTVVTGVTLYIKDAPTEGDANYALWVDNGATRLDGLLDLQSIAAGASDYDKFLVSDSGEVKYRTGAEVLSDIGGALEAIENQRWEDSSEQ